MKILMISNHLGVQSGVQRYVQNLLLNLDTDRYQIDLFVGQCPPDQTSTAPALEAHGVHIIAVPDHKKDRIRALAAHLEVSVITVKNAYEQLMAEGYIYGMEKKGYYVSPVQRPLTAPAHRQEAAPPAEHVWEMDLVTNSIAAEDFPFTVWARLMRQTILEQGTGLLRPMPPQGAPELRRAIAEEQAAAPAFDEEKWERARKARDKRFRVLQEEPGAWRVTGTNLERMVVQTDWENEEAIIYLQHRMARMGVDDALIKAGWKNGDEVRILGYAFDFDEDYEDDVEFIEFDVDDEEPATEDSQPEVGEEDPDVLA